MGNLPLSHHLAQQNKNNR